MDVTQCKDCGLYPTQTCSRSPCTRNMPSWARGIGAAYMAPPPKGCICPPTSEQTCERPDCGRKLWKPSAAGDMQ